MVVHAYYPSNVDAEKRNIAMCLWPVLDIYCSGVQPGLHDKTTTRLSQKKSICELMKG